MKKSSTLAEATELGTERDQLETLARILASAIDSAQYKKDIAPLAKQYRETMEAIRALDGGGTDEDADLDAIISSASTTRPRKAD